MRFRTVFTALCVLLAGACTIRPTEIPPELYWPLPPEKPRVKFVDFIFGSLDVTEGRADKFTKVVFGDVNDVPLLKPAFVAARNGVVYVTDINRLHIFDYVHHKFKVVGPGILSNATGVDVASNGNIYVADSGRGKILVFDPSGDMVDSFGSRDVLASPGGLVVDEARERILIADAKGHDIDVFSLAGEHLFSFGGRGMEPGTFNFPYDVAVDDDGYIYVVDAGNFRLQMFDPATGFVHAFGQVGVTPGSFARPKSVALDSEGYIYVTDASFGNFQIFDAAGRTYLAVGSTGLEPGKFLLPLGIAIDRNSDRVYVVDQFNRRIQVFQALKYADEEGVKPVTAKDVLF